MTASFDTRDRRGSRSTSVRALGTLVDQVVCSAGNFLVLLAALHVLNLAGLGAYTVAHTGVLILATIMRALIPEVLLARFSACPDEERLSATRQATGAALSLGLLVALSCGTVSLFLPGVVGPTLLAAGAVVPMILVQDTWRYHLFAAGRPWAAALNDAACLFSTLGSILLLQAAGPLSVERLLLAWGIGFSTGAVLGPLQTRIRPAPSCTLAWLRAHHDLGAPLAVAGFVGQFASRAGLGAVGVVGGITAVGQISASMTVLMPTNAVTLALALFAVPELARRRQRGDAAAADPYALWLGAALALLVMGFALVISLLPAPIGAAYAGSHWDDAQATLLPLALSSALTAVIHGLWVGLQTAGRQRAILSNSLHQGGLQFAGMVVGAAVWGVHGAAWGLAITTAASLVPWWRSWRRLDSAPSPTA